MKQRGNFMAYESHSPLNVTRVKDLTRLKGWLTNGAICLEGWSVEHTVEPPDAISLPALSEHMLALLCNVRGRRVNRFAGLEHDGGGYKNHLFLLPMGIPSEFVWESEDEVVLFGINHGALCRTAAQTECLNPDKIELKPLVFCLDDQITRLADCLLHEIRNGGASSHLYSESLLTAISVHLLRYYCAFEPQFKDYEGGLAPHTLRQVLDYIDANLADGDLSLVAMAELARLSHWYFARQFKQSTGYSPHQYIIRQRLQKAKQLLKQQDLPIMHVAIECGFSNQSHFYGAFRRVVGTTPKRYQQQLC